MPRYTYHARDESGALIKGVLEGESAAAVKSELFDQGLYPTSVLAVGFAFSMPQWLRKKVTTKTLLMFTRQLGALFKAGVPISRAMEILSRQVSHPGLKDAALVIQKDLQGGSTIAQAFGKHPHFFAPLYIRMLRIGEVGGVLDKSIEELVSILQKEAAIKTQIRNATLYPKILGLVILFVFFFVMSFVVPQFAQFYAERGVALPAITRFAIGLSDLIRAGWLIIFLCAGMAVVVYRKFAASPFGRRKIDRFKFKAPIFGRIYQMAVHARFAHMTTSLYRSGIPLSMALEVVAETIGNEIYADEIVRIRDLIEKGSALSTAMKQSEYFSFMMIEVSAIGEESGSIDYMLESIANYYEGEVGEFMQNLGAVIEPMLLFIVFLFVAMLAFSIFLPIWDLARVVVPG